MSKKIYKYRTKTPKPALFKNRRRGRKGWLEALMDPEEKAAPGTYRSGDKKTKDRENKAYRLRKKIKAGIPARKMRTMERLEWVTDKIRRCWSNRKIVLEFAKEFGLSKEFAAKHIKKVYTDFQKQFSDESKRTTLMAEHCSVLKEGAKIAMENGDLASFNLIMRQYAEVVGVLIAPSMIKFDQRNIDQRQQAVIVQNPEEMKATLASLENLSERDLFTTAYKSDPERTLTGGQGPVHVDDQEGEAGFPDRKTA